MSGSCVEKRECTNPKCESTSKKSLQIFLNDDDTFSAFCFCCKSVDKNPYGDNPPKLEDIHRKTPEEIKAEVDEVRECPLFLTKHRGIEAEDWKYFGVRLLLSTKDGKTPYGIAHPYTKSGKIAGFKIKLLHQKVMWNVGDVKGADFYGWERAKRIGGKTVYITEGEEDAIALRKILRIMSSNSAYDYAVISLPSGVNSVEMVFGRMAEELQQRFKEIVLVYDDDKAGRDAVKATRKIIPSCKVAILPCVDANECLLKGFMKATRDAVVFQADKPKGTPTLSVDDVMDDIMTDPVWGASYPWAGLTNLTYGQRKGELISIGAGTGIGKTLIGHELAAWNAAQHGWTALMIMMEETPAETYKSVAGKIDNVPYHVPVEEGGTPYDKEQLRETVNFLKPYVATWDIATIEDPETTWDQIKHVIRTQGHLYDVIMIDNATTLSEGLTSTEKNEFIGKVADEYAKLAKKFDFEAIIFSHLNPPPKGGRAHENGGKVLEHQFTGSRALQRYSHMMIGMERNKMAVDSDCSFIRLMKNRKFGKTGLLKSYYTQRTGRLAQENWNDDLYADRK